MDDYMKLENEVLRADIAHLTAENTSMRRKIKKMRKHLSHMEKGIIWRNNCIEDREGVV